MTNDEPRTLFILMKLFRIHSAFAIDSLRSPLRGSGFVIPRQLQPRKHPGGRR
jgi:hypothetical protein